MTFHFKQAQSVTVHADAAQLSVAVSQRIVALGQAALAERGQFHWVLTGGNTPKLCYRQLVNSPLDWSRVFIYFGDERCLPVGDAERNDRMAAETLLDQVPIPSSQIYRMAAELGPEAGAADYQARLPAGLQFDLTLLGMGEDGHIASLFPANPALTNPARVVPVFHSPKPPAERISLGLALINASRHKLFLVTGAGKRQALQQITAGVLLPAAQVSQAEWHLDQAAANIEGVI